MQLAGADLKGHDPADLAAFLDERGHEPFFITANARFNQLLEHDVEQGLAGEVSNEEGAGAALSTKGPGAQAALIVAVERDPHVFHVDERLPGRLTHYFNGVLIPQVIAAFYRVIGMLFPFVTPIGKGRVDAALGRV